MNLSSLGRLAWATATAVTMTAGCGAVPPVHKALQVVVEGESRELRKRPDNAPESAADRPPILLLLLDGVSRDLLYGMLAKGELPQFAELLGGTEAKGEKNGLAHAWLSESVLSTMPSSTMAAWTTAMTGTPPGVHGVTGNEFFIREQRRLGAPAPVSFTDIAPTLQIYTDSYLDSLKRAPSVYDRMREKEPNILVWVAMHQIHSGADKLIITKPTIVARALEHFVQDTPRKITQGEETHDAYRKLDDQVISAVNSQLSSGVVPDVLTVYLSGTDMYAHIAAEGPEPARTMYLKTVVDPAIGKLTAQLRKRGALADRYVVVTSDHGHTQVVHDEAHAMAMKGPDDPPALLEKLGLLVRPFTLDVATKHEFDAVYTPGGAMAYVYVADRSTCIGEKGKRKACDWYKPPRYAEDVLPIAEAFYKNNLDGGMVPAMKGALDMVLTRKPRAFEEDDVPFEVYVGGGRTVSVDAYLAEHPHATYVETARRLADLSQGPRGERAGDVALLAHNGDRDKPEDRFYFATPYNSWHGSPSRQDSEIPFIVAHPKRSTASLQKQVASVLGEKPRQQKLTDVLLDLRAKPRTGD